MNCPDHAKSLVTNRAGEAMCPRCQGAWVTDEGLDRLARGARSSLSVEVRPGSGAFRLSRRCPACETPLVPFRIAELEAWLDRCPDCEGYWVEDRDRTVLLRRLRNEVAAAEYAKLTPAERRALVTELAPKPKQEIHPGHALLARLGLPVIVDVARVRPSTTTLATTAALVVLWALGSVIVPGYPAIVALEGGSWSPIFAVTGVFAHFSVLHALGNAWFLVLFGDLVEQHLSPRAWVAAFLGIGALSLLAESAIAPEGVRIGGASGAVMGFVGAAVVLQPGARVVTAVGWWFVFALPLPLWAAFYALLQLVLFGIGAPGVAWVAHLVGLGLGIGLGAYVRSTEPALA